MLTVKENIDFYNVIDQYFDMPWIYPILALKAWEYGYEMDGIQEGDFLVGKTQRKNDIPIIIRSFSTFTELTNNDNIVGRRILINPHNEMIDLLALLVDGHINNEYGGSIDEISQHLYENKFGLDGKETDSQSLAKIIRENVPMIYGNPANLAHLLHNLGIRKINS